MGIFDGKFGRWLAGRVGGTKAVAKWDASPKHHRDNVVGDSAKQLAQQQLVDKYKPDAIRIVDDWVPVAKTKIGLLTAESIEREIIRLIERTDLVPAAASVPFQIAVSELMDRIDVTAYLSQGADGIDGLAEMLKSAIRGARL